MRVKSSMVTAVQWVTPEVARYWLKKCRIACKIYPAKVRKYANLMKQGRWTLTSQGISFDSDGYLVNGRHRLLAIILSGVKVPLNVTHGEPTESIINIDQSDIGRTIAAAMAADSGKRVVKDVAAIVNLMLISEFPSHKERFPTYMYVDFYEKHINAIQFVIEQFRANCRGISQAPLKAAIAKAWYHARKYKGGRDRLRTLCDVLKSGMPNSLKRDGAAIALKNHVQSGRFDRSGAKRYTIYLRMAYCIHKFMLGESISSVKAAPVDPFPLAEVPILLVNDSEIDVNLDAEVAALNATIDAAVLA